MDRLREKLLAIQARIPMVAGRGEEATKQALVLPMLDALGYDIWNPIEVCPEFEADFAIKKMGQREKVDLAIVLDGAPRIFIEVKPIDDTLTGHQGQLARYFNGAPTVSLGVLTNGVEYQFYTDTGEPNLLDVKPFFIVRLDSNDLALDVLARFHRSVLSAGAIREFATELNYTKRFVDLLRGELDLGQKDPSDAFVRWVMSSPDVYEGRLIGSVVERFRPIVKNALTMVLRDVVRRSVAAMDERVVSGQARTPSANGEGSAPAASPTHGQKVDQAVADAALSNIGRAVVTTPSELTAFAIIKAQFQASEVHHARIYDASLRREVPLELAYKDTSAYLGLYFNKPSWWFARLQLDAKQPWVALNLSMAQVEGNVPPECPLLPPQAHGEVRFALNSVDSLHRLNGLVVAAMAHTIEERRARGAE